MGAVPTGPERGLGAIVPVAGRTPATTLRQRILSLGATIEHSTNLVRTGQIGALDMAGNRNDRISARRTIASIFMLRRRRPEDGIGVPALAADWRIPRTLLLIAAVEVAVYLAGRRRRAQPS